MPGTETEYIETNMEIITRISDVASNLTTHFVISWLSEVVTLMHTLDVDNGRGSVSCGTVLHILF